VHVAAIHSTHNVSPHEDCFEIDPAAHLTEADDAERFFDTFGDRVPEAVRRQLAELRQRMRRL